MFRVLGSVSLLGMLVFGSVGAEPISKSKKLLIDELTAVIDSGPVLQQYTDIITKELREALAVQGIEIKEDIFELVKQATNEVADEILLNNSQIERKNIKVWDKYFDEAEIEDLILFFKTSTGKKYLRNTPEMAVANMNAFMSVQDEFVFTLQVRILEKLEQAGYENADLFGQNPSLNLEPIGPTLEELESLRREICLDADNQDQVLPIYRGPPKYPLLAQQHAVEGWVELAFTIRGDGTTEDIAVSNSSTGTMFDAAAIEATSQYLYCSGSKSQRSRIRIRFEMEKN